MRERLDHKPGEPPRPDTTRGARSFRNVARVLEPGWVFVTECFVPDLTRGDRDQRVHARAVTEDSAVIELSATSGRSNARRWQKTGEYHGLQI